MPKRILVVDDDESAARLLARFLREWDVSVALDGAEGISLAITERPDLVITDLFMPNIDGISMVREIKADPALRHVPVIFLTAAVDAPHVAAAISSGARHLLPKPIEVQRLLSIVRRTLGAPAHAA